MNRIEQLIEELCPRGVEYKEIESLIDDKSIITITPPSKLTKSLYKSVGTFPIIDQGQDFIVGYTNDKEKTIKEGSYIVFGDHTEAIKYVDFAFAQGADGIKILKTDIERIIPKYFYYSLNNFYIKTGRYTRHFSFLRITSIPIPPLPVQQEIVTILDTFTALDASLQAELEARRKQYEHYRNQLLNFEGKEVEWKTLGEVCQVIRGKRLTKNQLSEDEQYPVFHGGLEPLGFYGLSNRTANKVMVINVGASAGTVGFSFVDFWSSDGCFCIENSNILISRYLYYALVCQENILRSKVRVAGIPTLDAMVVEKIQIPIPPLSEQERIVGILDKFDALANTELPAEIDARRKQYEYYREKLLTFEPLAN